MKLNKNIQIKRSYVIAFVLVNFIIIGLYYAYGIFTIKQLKDDISHININERFVDMLINNEENNVVKAKANEKIEVKINLANNLERARYYRLVFKKSDSGVMLYAKDNDNVDGVLESNEKKEVSIIIENTTGNDVDVSFKCEESNTEMFDKSMGYSYINDEPNYDHSGANKPVYSDNMIPVYYDAISATEGVWKKADANNNDKYMWYDYDNYMWANAVTVNEEVRSKYQEALPGTEIVDSDINAFFVWIPKFKYYIINNDNTTTLENLINVNFVGSRSDVSEEGSVICKEAIANSQDKHLYSEICEDKTYGQLYNNLSTYTHPAFSSVTGFWIGKFANNNTQNIAIKPNTLLSIKSDINTSNVRKMQTVGNVYGFVGLTGYDEKTWNYASASNLEISPIDSMEWGAVAILANSLYGKSGNPLYQTTRDKSFTRVYNNISDSYSGRSTNYSVSSNAVRNTSAGTVYYNDLTNVSHKANMIEYPVGYRGAGASTTGTIYGVYDMAGGAHTTVMGVFMKEDGSSPYNMDKAYYTAYSYVPYKGAIDASTKKAYLEVFRLGDGVKEHVRTYTVDGMWQNGSLTLNNSGIMRRGGYTTSGSIFTTEINNEVDVYSTFTIVKFKNN